MMFKLQEYKFCREIGHCDPANLSGVEPGEKKNDIEGLISLEQWLHVPKRD